MNKIMYNESETIYNTTIPVLVSHINYGNHLGYDALLSLLQEARMRWLKEHGWAENHIEGNVGYIISDLQVSYKAEGLHGDLLRVLLYPDEVQRTSFLFRYQVINEHTHKVVALAVTKQVLFNYERRKVALRPKNFFSEYLT